MKKLFGTDGIRGIAGEKLTGDFAYLIGQCGAQILSEKCSNSKKILIGMDTRISSAMIENSLCGGISSCGIDVEKLSYVTTPAIGYLIQKHGFLGGVMISASHNPYEYNGIKFFDSNGVKLTDSVECEIENLYFQRKGDSFYKGTNIGKINYSLDKVNDYKEFLLSFLEGTSLEGLKIALDCANGSAYEIARDVFDKTGAEILIINNNPNGTNINYNCGSTHMEDICKFVTYNNCDFGFAYDGDGDRCLGVDNEGNIIDGDFIIGIIALYLKESGSLRGNTVVTTVMSNLGLYKFLDENDINVKKVSVGDKYVFQSMNENNYVVGGEQSGHIIVFDNKTGDGILTSLIISMIVKKKNKSLKELSKNIKKFPQVLLNINVGEENKTIYKTNKEIVDLIKKYENELSNNGRILIRESGTEDLIRIMIEGENKENIKKISENIGELIKLKCKNT